MLCTPQLEICDIRLTFLHAEAYGMFAVERDAII